MVALLKNSHGSEILLPGWVVADELFEGKWCNEIGYGVTLSVHRSK